MYYYCSSCHRFDRGGPGGYFHVTDVETEISALPGVTQLIMAEPGCKSRHTPSQDTVFLSNYARNERSRVHLKSPRNADQVKEPWPSPKFTSLHRASLTPQVVHIPWPISLHIHEHIKFQGLPVWLESAYMKPSSTYLVQLAFSHLPMSSKPFHIRPCRHT